MLLKRGSFKGGYKFGNLIGSPIGTLSQAKLSKEIIIPLKQGYGDEVPPIVKKDDRVKAGQIIGIDDSSCSSPVHSSANGIVKDITKINRFSKNINAIIVETDPSDNNIQKLSIPSLNDRNQISKALYLSGVSSLGRFGFPTDYNTSPLQPSEVKSLIIKAIYTEPYCLTNSILLSNDLKKFLQGIDILKKSLNDEIKVYLAINENDKNIIKQIKNTPNINWLNIYLLKPKYPQEHDIILTETILKKRITSFDTVLDMKAVIIDIQGVLHAYEAVIEGKPVIDRIIAIGGSGLEKGMFIKAYIGTSLEEILPKLSKSSENRVIYGGVMTGTKCDSLSITIDRETESISILKENRSRQFLFFLRAGIDRGSFSNAFISSLFYKADRNADTNLNGEIRPCIYCNYCEEVCPVGLMPYLLSKYAIHDMIDEASKYNPSSCIDCGLCTYVCPSKIHVMSHIQDTKEKIRAMKKG